MVADFLSPNKKPLLDAPPWQRLGRKLGRFGPAIAHKPRIKRLYYLDHTTPPLVLFAFKNVGGSRNGSVARKRVCCRVTLAKPAASALIAQVP